MVNTSRAISPPVNQSVMLVTSSTNQLAQSPKLFSDNFWGEKINGFEVLCQNLKHSLVSVKDLETFLRETANCEDTYVKVLNKLVSQIHRFSSNGTFSAVWSPLKELNERYALKHIELVQHLHELIKDIQRYNDELGKKIKKIRENETQTQITVQSFQEIQQTLNKAKEQYHNLCLDFEKQKRLLDPQQLQQLNQQISTTNLASLTSNNTLNGANLIGQTNNSAGLIATNSSVTQANSSNNATGGGTSTTATTSDRLSSLASSITVSKVSQVQKLEKKLKLAYEDYKSSIEKYNLVRVDFERKLADSCNHFQYAEETHLKQMRAFVELYSKLLTNINQSKQQIYVEFYTKFEQFTSDYLLQLFIENKRTGQERPDVAQFIDQCDYAKSLNQTNNLINSPSLSTNNTNNNNNNSIINEAEFNLFISDGNLFAGNTSLNSSNQIGYGSVLMPSINQQQQITPGNDIVDNKSNEFSFFNSNSTNTNNARGTPVFFNTSNIIGGSSLYSPLTNSVSTTTLNSIQPITNLTLAGPNTNNNNNLSSNSSSPITTQQQSLIISPAITTASSAAAVENMKRSDSKGINIFNVDFLGRNKNKEKKKAAAAAAALLTSTANNNNNNADVMAKSNKSNKLNKNNSNNKKGKLISSGPTSATTTVNQYENLNSSNSTQFSAHGLSVSNNSNRDSSSINSEDSNEQQQRNNTLHNQNINLSGLDAPAENDNNNNNSGLNATNNESEKIINTHVNDKSQTQSNHAQNPGSITARSISSITGSLSFDLLDQLKLSNGSDIDSEGYSIRPDSSDIGMRRRKNAGKNIGEQTKNKDNEDIISRNNLYACSSTESGSDDSDSENGDSYGGPIKVMLKIKPKSEIIENEKEKSTDVLREISQKLQLKPPGMKLSQNKPQTKKRTYYYNYGTSNPDQASSGWSTLDLSDENTKTNNNSMTTLGTNGGGALMTRSVSVGSVVNNQDVPITYDSNNQNGKQNSSSSTSKKDFLFDFGIDFLSNKPVVTTTATINSAYTNSTAISTSITSANNNLASPANANIPCSMSLSKVNETNLYNIDEDKEVESSFQYGQKNNLFKKANNYMSSSPANTQPLQNNLNLNNQMQTVSSLNNNNSASNNGRFTPACFPGRTTPDFRHTTSFFEQQGTRASIISPLTINGGSEIIPIAVALNETIHAYFKIGDASKFKVKCFGCMKISFPFAILKLLAVELAKLEFRLSNLQIANQDLKINNKLLKRIADSQVTSPILFDNSSSTNSENLQFEFVTSNLITELKQQHQQNKLAAFFNFELLKYEFKYSTTPLVLNARWTNNSAENTIELNLEYSFTFRKNLSQVNFMIIMPSLSNIQFNSSETIDVPKTLNKISLISSVPTALVQEIDNKLQVLWQMPIINSNGHINAKFLLPSLENQQFESFHQPVYVKFHVDNETLSQAKFEILSSNYKLSLLKERIETGKYFCNNDHQPTAATGAISNTETQQPTSKKPPFAGSLSTSIGSTADLFLNN